MEVEKEFEAYEKSIVSAMIFAPVMEHQPERGSNTNTPSYEFGILRFKAIILATVESESEEFKRLFRFLKMLRRTEKI